MQQEIYGGRYRVIKRIGEGGMAFVYLAMDEKLGRKVAIKVLHEHMERNSEIRQRFQMEAQAISGLDHPNIVKIYDFSGSRSDRLWIVTEVIKGYNLAEFIQRFSKGWIHSILAACIVQEICKALEKAHSQGIIHRDIKPENIMLTSEGRVKLMDFGIAKDLGKASMTVTGTFMGSPSYMSPEQIRGRSIDSRSDIYSLSVLFYEVITARLPFTGTTTHDVVLKIVEGQYTHPKYIIPGLADAINQLITTGMSRDPAARQQTIGEYSREVSQYLANMGFDESHIELERFFKDRKNFEQRLALLSKMYNQPTRTFGLPPAPVRKARGSQAARSRYEQSRLYRTSNSWKEDRHAATHQASQRTSHQASSHKAKQHPSVRSAKHRKSKNTVLPASTRTALDIPPPPAPAGPLTSVGQAQAKPKRQRHVPKGLRHPHAARRRQRDTYTQTQPHALTSFLGVLMVSAVITVSAWGFWQLQLQLSTISNSSVSNSQQNHTATANRRPNASTASGQQHPNSEMARKQPLHSEVASSAQANLSNTSSERAKEEAPAASSNQAQKIADRTTGSRTAHKRPYNRGSRTTSQSRSNFSEKTATLQNHRSAQPTTASVASGYDADSTSTSRASPSQSSLPQKDTTSAEPTASSQTDAGQKPESISFAWVAVSSEPAAEVFIDGQRLGTTVDKVSQSGWLKVQADKDITLSLKRTGYKTHTQQINIDAGERKQLHNIKLDRVALAEPQDRMLQLTIATNRIPSTLKVENLDNQQVKTVELRDLRKSLALKPGNYLMIIEYNNQKIERRMNLTGQNSSLIFSAMFKD